MVIDYERLRKEINEFGHYILNCIKNQYNESLDKHAEKIDSLLSEDFIVIHEPTEEDIEFFSLQEGILNPEKYSVDYVPSAHGGKTKGDGKIHIYPYTKSFENCSNTEELNDVIKRDIVIHEIFHYFISLTINDDESLENRFASFLTEGLVQYYTEEFAARNNLSAPISNYGKNVEAAKEVIRSFGEGINRTEIDEYIFTKNIDEIKSISSIANELFDEYVDNHQFREKLTSLLTVLGIEIGFEKDSVELKKSIRHFTKIDDMNVLFNEFYSLIRPKYENKIEKLNVYMMKLRNIIFERKTFSMKLDRIKEMKSVCSNIEELRNALGDDSILLEFFPEIINDYNNEFVFGEEITLEDDSFGTK